MFVVLCSRDTASRPLPGHLGGSSGQTLGRCRVFSALCETREPGSAKTGQGDEK
jgi:hypothetical protein